MVAAAFPVAKLGALLLKQVSKPIANLAKERAKSHPFFRQYVCMPPAQFYHWCEIKMKMWVMNLGKPVEIPKLNEAMAIELGANLLGEGIIFMIAAAILYSEYARGVRKEAAKEEAKKQEMICLQEALKELHFTTEAQNAQIKELMREVHNLEMKLSKARPYAPTPKSESPPPKSPDEPLVSNIERHDINSVESDYVKPGLIISALDYVTYAMPNKLFENY